MQPMQPFDPEVAFPAGNYESERITLLGPEGFAVLAESDEDVIQSLRHRDTGGDPRSVGAFRQHPLSFRLQPRLAEKGRERHAGPFAATEQTVALLRVR